MAGELEIRTDGAQEFARLARDLRRAGAGGIRKRLYAGLQRSGRPAIDAARASAAETLPSSGGAGARRSRLKRTGTKTIGGTTFVTRTRVAGKGYKAGDSLAARAAKARYKITAVAGKDPRIRITATSGGKKLDLERADDGTIRHMVWGNRRVWVSQTVPAGWFTRPMEQNAEVVRRELESVVDEIERDITG